MKIPPNAPRAQVLDALCDALDLIDPVDLSQPVREHLAGGASADRLHDSVSAHAQHGCAAAAAPSVDPPAPAPPRGPPLRPPPPDPDVERGRRDAAAEIRAKRHAAEQGYSVGAGVPLAWARPLPRLPLALPPHIGG